MACAACGRPPQHDITADRRIFAANTHGTPLTQAERISERRACGLTDEDAADGRGVLETGGDVDRIAHHRKGALA